MTDTMIERAKIEALARELWWPHHASRTRTTALAALDDGDVGEVTLEFGDFVTMVSAIIAAVGSPVNAALSEKQG